jgi:Uncharacterized protein conserved in bacteria
MTTPIPRSYVYLSKLTIVLKVTILTQIWVGILYFICGKLVGLPGFVPVQILLWLLRGCLGGIVIAALQLLLSMKIRSFSIPIAIALAGSILGLMISNGGKGLFWPYSLMLLGMNANKGNDMLANMGIQFFISAVCFLIVITGISIWRLKTEDVTTA